MLIKSLIAGTAMVMAFGVGSAIADDSFDRTTITPQHLNLLSDGFLVNLQPMAAAQLEMVRGTWWPVNPNAAARVAVIHAGGNRGLGGSPPRGQQ